MYDVLVYLYETYYRPDACPAPAALERKLADIGFEQDEITEALDWLDGLVKVSDEFSSGALHSCANSSGMRIYAAEEQLSLGVETVGFIQFLELAGVVNPVEREIVIERALAASEAPLPLDQLKIIVLMTLWNAGKEPGAIVFDELFFDSDDGLPRLMH